MLGQNLVVNGDFESYNTCPLHIVNIDKLLDDISLPTASSGDYYNECNKGEFSVPLNFKGNQAAIGGSGYTGLYFYALNDYREYLQMNTAKTLRAKHPYKISIQVSLAESSTLAVKNMSVLLANKKIRLPNSSALTSGRLNKLENDEYYELALTADRSLTESDSWITLTAEFDARGFENHILIGNFSDNENTRLLNNNQDVQSSDFSYYYVDNVVLEELPRVNYDEDKIYVLEHNPLEPKGYELDDEAIASVQKIFKFLKENAEVQMKITGHVSNLESPEYNQFISSLRARAVALYLKKLGIDDSRLVWEGVGDTKPLRNGNIKNGKLGNGRVEFVMTKFDDQ
ncbi:MAG: OmpA family protein [Croceitalea sp.]|nr:OmpA family protein [Croceitalea sp.]